MAKKLPPDVLAYFREQGAKGGRIGGASLETMTPAQRVARAKKASAAAVAARKRAARSRRPSDRIKGNRLPESVTPRSAVSTTTIAGRSFGQRTGRPWGQDLHRHVATELRVARAIDLAHSARAQGRRDLLDAEAGAGSKGQTRDHTGRKAAGVGFSVLRRSPRTALCHLQISRDRVRGNRCACGRRFLGLGSNRQVAGDTGHRPRPLRASGAQR